MCQTRLAHVPWQTSTFAQAQEPITVIHHHHIVHGDHVHHIDTIEHIPGDHGHDHVELLCRTSGSGLRVYDVFNSFGGDKDTHGTSRLVSMSVPARSPYDCHAGIANWKVPVLRTVCQCLAPGAQVQHATGHRALGRPAGQTTRRPEILVDGGCAA